MFSFHKRGFLPLCVVMVVFLSAVNAQAVLISTSSTDRIRGESQGSATPNGYFQNLGGQIGVGGALSNRFHDNPIIGFLLPTLAPGATITAATLSVLKSSSNSAAADGSLGIDLWGIDADPTGTGTLFFKENENTAEANTTFLIQNWFTINSANDTKSSAGLDGNSSTEESTLVGWINSKYIGANPTVSEVFFRLNIGSDLDFSPITRANITSSLSVLELTVQSPPVPEPASLLTMTLALSCIAARRRRRTV